MAQTFCRKRISTSATVVISAILLSTSITTHAVTASHAEPPTVQGVNMSTVQQAIDAYLHGTIQENGNGKFPYYDADARSVKQLSFSGFTRGLSHIPGQMLYFVRPAKFVDGHGRNYRIDFLVSYDGKLVTTARHIEQSTHTNASLTEPTTGYDSPSDQDVATHIPEDDGIIIPETVDEMEYEISDLLSGSEASSEEIDEIFQSMRGETGGDQVQGQQANPVVAQKYAGALKLLKDTEVSGDEAVGILKQLFPAPKVSQPSRTGQPQ